LNKICGFENRNEWDSDVLGPSSSIQHSSVALGQRVNEYALSKTGGITLGSFTLGRHCYLAVPQENLLSSITDANVSNIFENEM
jgi:hypothetical protein